MPTPLTPSAAESSARLLSELLPLIRAFGLLAQDSHWRALGPAFGSLHSLFGELYGFVGGTYADGVAERIAQLGGIPPSTIAALPLSANREGLALAREIANHGRMVGAKAYAVQDAMSGIDPIFQAKLQDLQVQLEALLWKIESHAS